MQNVSRSILNPSSFCDGRGAVASNVSWSIFIDLQNPTFLKLPAKELAADFGYMSRYVSAIRCLMSCRNFRTSSTTKRLIINFLDLTLFFYLITPTTAQHAIRRRQAQRWLLHARYRVWHGKREQRT